MNFITRKQNDMNIVTKTDCSYRLKVTDQLPKGKRSGKSLREKEAEIEALLQDNLDIEGSRLTLLELVEKYLDQLYSKKALSHNTKVGYNINWDIWRLEKYDLSIVKNGLLI